MNNHTKSPRCLVVGVNSISKIFQEDLLHNYRLKVAVPKLKSKSMIMRSGQSDQDSLSSKKLWLVVK